MKFMKLMVALALVGFSACSYAEKFMIVNDSSKELKVVGAHKIFDRAVIIAPGQTGTFETEGFLNKMGAAQKLKFHQDGVKTYVMDIRFNAGKEETIKYSQIQAGNFKPQVNPKTNQKEVRFVVTPVGRVDKLHAKKDAAPQQEKVKKEKVKKEKKTKASKKEKVKKEKKPKNANAEKAQADKKDAGCSACGCTKKSCHEKEKKQSRREKTYGKKAEATA